MSDPSELKPEDIMQWANHYASYEELENTAKAVYGIYVHWRKRDYPQKQKQAKKRKKWSSK